MIPGYSAVARVIEVGAEVEGFAVGDLVSGRNPAKSLPGINTMWGGQASCHVYATTGEDRAVLLPKGAEPLDYVVTEVAAISFRGVEAANPVAGETAIVFGQGMIGAFSAAWLLDRNCRVIVCDIEEHRLEYAASMGVAATVNMRDENAMARLDILCNGGADIVVESSGTIAGVKAAFKCVRKKPQAYGVEYKVEPIGFYKSDWPRLVMQANYLEQVSLNPFNFFSGEGVTILTPFDRGVEDRQKVIEAIRTGRLAGKNYIEQVVPYDKAKAVYAALVNKEILSAAFQWAE